MPSRHKPASRAAVVCAAILMLYAAGVPARAVVTHQVTDRDVPVDLDITFTLHPEPIPLVELAMRVRGDADGSTRFTLPESWADVSDTRDAIRRVRATTDDGAPLQIAPDGDHAWIVTHPPGAAISLAYILIDVKADLDATPPEYKRIVIRDDFFHLVGAVGLIRPDSVEDVTPCHIRVHYAGFAEAGWTVASSFSSDQDGFDVSTTFGQFEQSDLVAGDLRLLERRIGDATVRFSVHGWNLQFSDDAFADAATSIIKAQRDFFDDHSQPDFFIDLFQFGHADEHSLGGTALTNSFLAAVTARYRLDDGDDTAYDLKRLFSHELFHQWNGHLIQRIQPEEAATWFSEGFTDFYARELLHRAGLSDDATYVDRTNRMIRTALTHPQRNLPNDEMAAGYWAHGGYDNLAYARGDLIAILLDHDIRLHTDGRQSLDDVMKDLLRRARSRDERVSTPSLLERFAAYASPAGVEMVRRALEGELPAVPLDLLEPLAAGEEEQATVFDLGFDLRASRDSGVMTSVREGSAAWRAGLRDGQALRGMSVWFGSTDQDATFTVLDDGEERSISYRPVSDETIPIVQFHMKR